MNQIRPTTTLRIARPTHEISAAEAFWTAGLGFSVLWRTAQLEPGEHALVMVGLPTANWHLELVEDALAARANPPGPEDLLVLYLGEKPTQILLNRLETYGGTIVQAKNLYWNTWGVTVQDPDGYLLVLSCRSWDQ